MASNISNQSTIPNNEDDEKVVSGSTSPEEPRSVFSGRRRSNTETTLVSSPETTTDSVSIAQHADVPANTPVGGSVAGESVRMERVLKRVSTLTVDANGIVPIGGQDSKQDPNGVMESTMWDGEAMEMAALGLKRLVQLAKDENAGEDSKTVEQYYSEHLSKVIKEAEIEFDATTLQ